MPTEIEELPCEREFLPSLPTPEQMWAVGGVLMTTQGACIMMDTIPVIMREIPCLPLRTNNAH